MQWVDAGGRRCGRALVVALMIGLTAMVARPAESFAAPNAEIVAAKAQPKGSVYLFLGLLNVFSTGLDTLNTKLKAQGVPSTVMSYVGWGGPASEVEARYARDRNRARPIVIVGHSFGSDAALAMAARLNQKKIPVDLVVIFDATQRQPVPANVRHLINYYSPNGGVGKRLSGGKGFNGRLENINIDKLGKHIDHLNIEKQAAFHRRVIAEVLRLYGGARQAGLQ